ncbi:MAG: hypothetical protein IJW92_02560, partial [Clostridia bacterium]|nr:hypothetical protein [Clostridia bacterium]
KFVQYYKLNIFGLQSEHPTMWDALKNFMKHFVDEFPAERRRRRLPPRPRANANAENLDICARLGSESHQTLVEHPTMWDALKIFQTVDKRTYE